MEWLKLLALVLLGAEYILLHELGHFAVAAYFGLNPQIVMQAGNFATGFFLGVSHAPAGPVETGIIIRGASMLPLLLSIAAASYVFKSGRVELLFIAEIFLLLVLVNLVPLPGLEQADANKLFSIMQSLKN